ncbi:copper resistance protein [uncultured Vibrio sp.]|uniref:copper resistance protein n=1 Tax=uncultured Vibrio sp. TaxID=114054 RepID=UPI0025D82FAE|nr:copper resistance protein [uncultured Vibrio sp.]
MKTPRHKYKLARWSLAIVWWVVFVCVAQNSGIFQVCQLGYTSSSVSSGSVSYLEDSASLAQKEEGGFTQECELSKQLLNAHQHQVDDYPLIMFIVALFILSMLVARPYSYSSFTEPIVPKRRTHLRLCVFRE